MTLASDQLTSTAARRADSIDLARLIDHALLHPAAGPQHVEQWCAEADRFGFVGLCVMPVHVRQAVSLLHNRPTAVICEIGFPSGATTALVKRTEAAEALDHGARELEVVLNLGLLKAGQTDAVHREIAEIVEMAGSSAPVKVILEWSLLEPAERQLAVELAMDAGAAFLKTHTGWNGGVSIEDVRQLKEWTRGRVGIKAAGGIHTVEQALDLVEAGATRLGTSRGVEFLRRDRSPWSGASQDEQESAAE
ncbi:MAG: deoxyribose-phosphate aldolase [Oscillatoriales cyanobacterium]|nr:MAG: deoxyribose-phosphate aldolase [Oscillatoriales cyanobacterium]